MERERKKAEKEKAEKEKEKEKAHKARMFKCLLIKPPQPLPDGSMPLTRLPSAVPETIKRMQIDMLRQHPEVLGQIYMYWESAQYGMILMRDCST